jgi:hypothetical protein
MDMEEVLEGEDEKFGMRRVKFKLVESAMFNDFSGEWRLQCYSRIRTNCSEGDDEEEFTYSTKLFYMVTVKPKGPVPVAALEWRIKEDVPINLRVSRDGDGLPPGAVMIDSLLCAGCQVGDRESALGLQRNPGIAQGPIPDGHAMAE